jgi:hypothetical protein
VTLAERFTRRLEGELAAAEKVLGKHPERVIAVRLMLGAGPEVELAGEARLATALRTNDDAPHLPTVAFALAPGLQDGTDARSELVGSMERLLSRDKRTGALGVRALAPGFDVRRLQHANVRAPATFDAWPEGVPDSVTVAEAFALARRELPELVRDLAEEAEAFVRLLVTNEAHLLAVLGRESLVSGWLLPDRVNEPVGWFAYSMILNAHGAVEHGEEWGGSVTWDRPHPLLMPDGVDYGSALEWAREPLARAIGAEEITDALRDNPTPAREPREGTVARRHSFVLPPDVNGVERELYPYHLAVVYRAWREVERDRRRPGLRLDAGSPHHHMLAGWVALPKDAREGGRKGSYLRHDDGTGGGWVELVPPRGSGKPVSLGLPGVLAEGFVRALREWRSYRGLRHWAAFQHGLSMNRGEGWFTWTLERHLEAMGIPRSEWREELLREVAEDVELFTELEFAVRDAPNGKVRQRFKVFEVIKQDVLDGGRWRLDGTRFRPNPLIYSGVRKESGALGSNFGWAPAELPQVRDNRHGPALALGLLLPIRWRWVLLNEGKDHLALSGANVLELAGIAYHRHKPGEAWDRLERNLHELARVNGVGRWEWDEHGEKGNRERRPDLHNVLRLYPPTWVRDRMLHGVSPLELGPAPLTGAELHGWRKRRGLSQAAAAKALGVNERTVRRAEVAASAPLGPSLRDALREALDAAA